MLACFRQGYVVLPCTEQLRAKDLEQRLAVAQPRIVVADPRNADLLGDREFDLARRRRPRRRRPSSAPRTRA